MANDSASGGYLAPADTPVPDEDVDLDAIFQQLVVGIAGLPGNLVRPRWQPVAPKQPEANVTWCALGVTSGKTPAIGAVIEHQSAGEGADQLTAHESIEAMASFYGPQSQAIATRLRDGLAIPQNLDALRAKGFGFLECSAIRSVPEFVNTAWLRRYDMTAYFRRKVVRVYPVRNVLAADIHLFDDTHVDEVIHVPPV